MSPETFPVLRRSAAVSTVEMRSWPSSIPWELADKWRARIERNHNTTLEDLAKRGGLTPVELWLAAHDLEIGRFADVTERAAAAWLAGPHR